MHKFSDLKHPGMNAIITIPLQFKHSHTKNPKVQRTAIFYFAQVFLCIILFHLTSNSAQRARSHLKESYIIKDTLKRMKNGSVYFIDKFVLLNFHKVKFISVFWLLMIKCFSFLAVVFFSKLFFNVDFWDFQVIVHL